MSYQVTKMKFKKTKGLAVIEIMLATALLIGVILFVMKGMHNATQTQLPEKSAGHYATLTNDIMQKFTSEMKDCQNNTNCDVEAIDQSATNYLDLDSSAVEQLQALGVDPDQVTVEICPSDDGSGC